MILARWYLFPNPVKYWPLTIFLLISRAEINGESDLTPEYPYSISVHCAQSTVRLYSMNGIPCIPRINVPYDYAANMSELRGVTGTLLL